MITRLLISRFIADYDKVYDAEVRKDYGFLSGMTGICINVLLCLTKLTLGVISGSVAIIGDGINNLSDAISSVVTIWGLRLSAKPADEGHPFGHGRIEYLAGLIVAGVIILVGLQLLYNSLKKLFYPEAMEFSIWMVGILVIAVLLKLWLGLFNRFIGKKLNSPAFTAVAADSFNDCLATTAVIVCLLIYELFGVNLDGVAGSLVACFIIYSGWQAAREALQPILGSPADISLLEELREISLRDKRVIGIHDLVVHNYGPGRLFVSVHIEVSSHMNIMTAHSIAQSIEEKIEESYGAIVTVHIDPMVLGDSVHDSLKAQISLILEDIDVRLTMHDFRVVAGQKLVFDIEAPYKCLLSDRDIQEKVHREFTNIFGDKYKLSIKLDRV